jgi:membrane-associated PAP2 superfamily phosphatase
VLWFLYGVDVLGRCILLCSIMCFLAMLVKKHNQTFNAFVVMVCLIMGPLLAVNMIFKDHWGRARPMQIEAFGGTKKFTAPWVMNDQCHHNCSFPCGHAAAGFVLSIGTLVSRRKFWLPAGIALGASFGLVRMLNGAHFLSDVIFSYFIVMLTSGGTALVISATILSMIHRNQVKKVG